MTQQIMDVGTADGGGDLGITDEERTRVASPGHTTGQTLSPACTQFTISPDGTATGLMARLLARYSADPRNRPG